MIPSKNFQAIARTLVAAVLALIVVAVSMTRPVLADGAASTRNIILGAAAAVAGIIIANNIHHKQVAHNTVVGYTPDGGTVYADGRIVYPNGMVLYTGNNGTPCAWDGSAQYCGTNPTAYYPNNNYGYQNGPYSNNGPYYNGDNGQDADDNYSYTTTSNRPVNGRNVYYYSNAGRGNLNPAGHWNNGHHAHPNGDRDDRRDRGD
jgi:hypothetical protein